MLKNINESYNRFLHYMRYDKFSSHTKVYFFSTACLHLLLAPFILVLLWTHFE